MIYFYAMVSFSTKKVLTETLGEKIRFFREKKNVSLEEVSCRIGVKKDYLEKIEKNLLFGLPPEVYVYGYLKKYACFLGLDEKLILEQYKKEKGIQQNISAWKNPEKELPRLNNFSLTVTPKLLVFLSFFGLFIFGSVYFYGEIKKLSSNPLLILAISQNNFSVDKDWVEIEGSVEKDSRVFINNQGVSVDSEGKFKEKIFLRKGENKIIVKAMNKFEKETVRELDVYAWYESAYLMDTKEQREF